MWFTLGIIPGVTPHHIRRKSWKKDLLPVGQNFGFGSTFEPDVCTPILKLIDQLSTLFQIGTYLRLWKITSNLFESRFNNDICWTKQIKKERMWFLHCVHFYSNTNKTDLFAFQAVRKIQYLFQNGKKYFQSKFLRKKRSELPWVLCLSGPTFQNGVNCEDVLVLQS